MSSSCETSQILFFRYFGILRLAKTILATSPKGINYESNGKCTATQSDADNYWARSISEESFPSLKKNLLLEQFEKFPEYKISHALSYLKKYTFQNQRKSKCKKHK